MPIHEYICKNCKTTFSIRAPFSAFLGLIPTCPKCKTTEVIKKLFAPLVIFNSDGFYKTDNEKHDE